MAYNKTLKVDQLFVRDITFKDYGNRPISSYQVLLTGCDGRIFFSSITNSGSSIGSYNYVQIDSTFTYGASNLTTNTLYLASGNGISLNNTSNLGSGINALTINSLDPQNLYIYDTKQTLHFSSLVSQQNGRTYNFAGFNGISISLSTNTVRFDNTFNSSLSSFSDLLSTASTIINLNSTQIGEIGALISSLDVFLIITNFSTIYQQLNTFSTTLYDLSTFVLSTSFVNDGPSDSNHTKLVVKTISTQNITTKFVNTSTILIGSNLFYDSKLGNNSTPDCIHYTPVAEFSTLTNYLHIKDATTTVDVSLEKRYLASQSTGSEGDTYTSLAMIAQLGMYTGLGAYSTFRPITEQIEAYSYKVDTTGFSTGLSYTVDNGIYADAICAQSSLIVTAPGGVYTSTLNWSNANGEMATISTMCVSTIVGYSSPILTFDKVNNRLGVNLGQLQPRATLDISGVVYANHFVTSSDRRLKSDIKQLKGLNYLSTYSYTHAGMEDIGVLADEVELIAPSCVYQRPDGFKAVSYQKLIPVLLTYIHDLNDRLKRVEAGVPAASVPTAVPTIPAASSGIPTSHASKNKGLNKKK